MTRVLRSIMGALTATAVLTAACQAQASSGNRTRIGHSLAPSRPGTVVSIRDVRAGLRVYLIEPAPRNTSNAPLTILRVAIRNVPDSLAVGCQCSYSKTPDGVTVATWANDGKDPDWDPKRLHPRPLAGTTLAAHADLPKGRYALASFRVIKATPAIASDVIYTYRQGGVTYQQLMTWRFSINGSR